MKRKSYHVIPRPDGNGWSVKRWGAKRASKVFSYNEKFSAVMYARRLAISVNSAVYVHGDDGRYGRYDTIIPAKLM